MILPSHLADSASRESTNGIKFLAKNHAYLQYILKQTRKRLRGLAAKGILVEYQVTWTSIARQQRLRD